MTKINELRRPSPEAVIRCLVALAAAIEKPIPPKRTPPAPPKN